MKNLTRALRRSTLLTRANSEALSGPMVLKNNPNAP